jgi:hypothetical protein
VRECRKNPNGPVHVRFTGFGKTPKESRLSNIQHTHQEVREDGRDPVILLNGRRSAAVDRFLPSLRDRSLASLLSRETRYLPSAHMIAGYICGLLSMKARDIDHPVTFCWCLAKAGARQLRLLWVLVCQAGSRVEQVVLARGIRSAGP